MKQDKHKKAINPNRFPVVTTTAIPSFWDTLRESMKYFFKILWLVLYIISLPFLAIYQSLWPGSVDTRVRESAQEYLWHPSGKPKRGILFIHGFTSTPKIFKKYAQLFLSEGYLVYGIRLEGHGTSPDHLATTNAADWYKSARSKYIEMKKMIDDVIIVAHSMGTLLAFLLASIYPVHSMVILSSPIKVRDKPLYKANFLLRPISKLVKYWPYGVRKLKALDDVGLGSDVVYHQIPLVSVAGLFDTMKVTQERLNKISCPILVMLGDADEHIHLSSLDYLQEKLGNNIKDVWIAPDATHILLDTSEIELFEQKIADFVLQYSPPVSQ